jgi:CTP synthase (UTP-ammonia lyase)
MTKKTINIGIIGDYDVNKVSHAATNTAITHAAKQLSLATNVVWLPTPTLLTEEGQQKLTLFDAIWASPGSPYQSLEGALIGIKLARESQRPFIGT